MTVEDYIKSTCSTEGLAPLSRQIAVQLINSLPTTAIRDISGFVNIVGGSTLPYLQTDAANALEAAVREFGKKPRLVHALRVLPQQAAVYSWYLKHKCGIPLAAAPGTSPHERAVSIDLNDWQDWIPVLSRHDWIWRGNADKPHFNFHGRNDPDFGHEGVRAFQTLYSKHNPSDPLTMDGVIGPHTQRALMASSIAGWV